MTEIISLKDLDDEVKVALLRELGYDTDGTLVLKDGVPFIDRYTDEPVRYNDMMILPGSTIIINNHPLSIISYLEDYGEPA